MWSLRSGLLIVTLVAAIGCGSDASAPAPGAPTAGAPASSPPASIPSDAQRSLAPRVFFEIDIAGRTALLDLTLNDTLLAKDYREYMATEHGLEELPRPAQRPACMYRGHVAWADGRNSTGPAWSALNTCQGFQGLIAIDGETWVVAPSSLDDEVLVSRLSEGLAAHAVRTRLRQSAGPQSPLPQRADPQDARSRSSGAGSVVAERAEALVAPTKYLELVVVSDAARFEELGLAAPSDALQLANLVDAIYRNGTLTPSIAIVVTSNIVIPGGTDPWPVPATAEVDADVLLINFGSWTRTHLPAGDEYVLLTQLDLTGQTVGLAFTGATCTPNNQAIIQATLTQAQTATTIAHEVGHSLGMSHDTGDCSIGGPYVMSPSLSVPAATIWSSCSTTALASYLTTLGSPGCLANVPVAVPATGPICGNGIREAGEGCDCGSTNCAGFDPCCDGNVCQLVAGAACSELDGCCQSCQIAPQGTQCEASSACSPAATCSGLSVACPTVAPLANGLACSEAGASGACLQGRCEQSRDQQCGSYQAGTTSCNATSCTRLYCNINSQCGYFLDGDGAPIQVLAGTTCGDGMQCYQGSCVASTTIPVCANGTPVNACGGCSSLAASPGSACNSCGSMQCITPSDVACSVAEASACPSWLAGAWSACSAACGGGTQTRSVTCQDASGTALSDAQCAAAGAKPATQQVCNSAACISYEWLVGSFGACSVACGSGTQSRSVACVQSGTTSVVADSFCTSAKPVSSQACAAACNTGYQCLAGSCSPIDACASAPCAVGEVCTSTGPGTYSCADLNECLSNNGGCDPRVTCSNTAGGRTCGALDACHPQYLCPAATANCPVTAAPDGTQCSDQNACTQSDVCRAGACVGSNPIVCATTGTCQLPGSCNPSTGMCGAPVSDPACNHCHDGIKNGGETGMDCGGSQCLACKGAACSADAECASGSCKLNKGKKSGGQCGP
jgi:hypothetical protein